MKKRAIIVAGLGYGDEGKGNVVDYLVRKYKAHTVIRFNGGPQAAHHVVDPSGILHCFSQFGSGTFVQGTQTFLSRFMLVDPLALEREGNVLIEKDISDCFNRIAIDERCLIVTPFHKIIGRMLEISRGAARHGSCGMGVGQAITDGTQMGEKALTAGDLRNKSIVLEKLNLLWRIKVDIAEQLSEQQPENSQLWEYLEKLAKVDIDEIAEIYGKFRDKVKIVSSGYIAEILGKEGAVIFEGAQGVLLDVNRGFWPYVTKTDTTFANAEKLLDEVGYSGNIHRLGVSRAYNTRHGAGPFITEYPMLAKLIPDIHNGCNDWQGKFRIGWLDFVALKYAVEIAGNIDSIALTNFDRLNGFNPIYIGTGYNYDSDFKEISQLFDYEKNGGNIKIKGIKVPDKTSREHQNKLAELLYNCRPIYKKIKKEELVHFIEDKLKIFISIKSVGPKAADKIQLKTLY